MFYRNIRTYLLLFSIISINLSLFSQESEENVQNTTDLVEEFPEKWVGNWIGNLEIYNGEGLQQELPMELQIHPIAGTPNYQWWIIYGEDKEKGKRAYELKPKDPEKGIWVVDELNSIVLECYFLKDKLFSRYDVSGNALLVTNEVDGEEMIFEVVFGGDEAVSTTGGVKDGEEDIPQVLAFPIKGMQRAVLNRQGN